MNIRSLKSSRHTGFQPSFNKLFGLLILVASVAILFYQLSVLLTTNEVVRHSFYAGMIAAGSTAVGAALAIFTKQITHKMLDTLMGFGAGVMLAASIFSLIIPSMEIMEAQTSSMLLASSKVAFAILIGAGLMLLMEKAVPHEHFFKGSDQVAKTRLRQSWLFVLAIALHNVPEGLAIGAAFAAGDGHSLAIGIAIQDMPEGFIVAMALIAAGYSRLFSISIGILSGLTEPIMAIVGATMMDVSTYLLPWGLAAAAGAMLFVISHEIIPESHRKGHEFYATNGLMLGFVLMLILDTAI